MSGLVVGGISLVTHIFPTAVLSQSKLLCFDRGACTVSASDQGSVKIENTGSNSDHDYSGVYILNSTFSGQSLNNINQLSFDYVSDIVIQPWNLSLNVPIDTDANNETDTYLIIDAFYCPGLGGSVNVISDPICGIFVNNVRYTNWESLITANPTWKVGPDDARPFIFAVRADVDPPAIWNVNNISLGKAK